MAPIRLHRTVTCAIASDKKNPKVLSNTEKVTIKTQKPLPNPPAISHKGCTTLYGHFSVALPCDPSLATPNTEGKFLEVPNLHPLEDSTLIGPHTMLPVIRRDDASGEVSIDWSRREIRPIYGSRRLGIDPFPNVIQMIENPLPSPSNFPTTVTDRIAHFESMCYIGESKTFSHAKNEISVENQLTKLVESKVLPCATKDICDEKLPATMKEHDENVVQPLDKLLKVIGELPPAFISPKLERISMEWWQTVQVNQLCQRDDEYFVDLSASLNFMGAALDPRCANLEVQALDELARLRTCPKQLGL